MKGSLVKASASFASFLLLGLTPPAFAQYAEYGSPYDNAPVVSGPFTTPPVYDDIPVTIDEEPLAVTPPVPAPTLTPPQKAVPTPNKSGLKIEPVTASSLPNISAEMLGTSGAEGLGPDMWKGTERSMAEKLVAMIAPSKSPILNDLVLRLLKTAAISPEGQPETPSKLTSDRIVKLALFGSSEEAWSLASEANSSLVDKTSFRFAAENTFLDDDDSICAHAPDFVKSRLRAEGQELLIACNIRAKKNHEAQVAMDVARAGNDQDTTFLSIVDKNILGGSKALPTNWSSITPLTVALLQRVNQPLPDSFYAKADFMYAPALIRLPAQKELTRIVFAERASERGFLNPEELAKVYRSVAFPPTALATPMASKETGAKLRALLFRASEGTKDANQKIALAVKFIRSSPPSFLNGGGAIAAQMIGDIDPSPTTVKDAVIIARIYRLARKYDLAMSWYNVAKANDVCADELQAYWPEFAVDGFESESGAYQESFNTWFTQANKTADTKTTSNILVPTLLLLEAAGMDVPDFSWSALISTAQENSKISASPLLLKRLQDAASFKRRAETVLLAASLTGENDFSLTDAIGVTAALTQIGLTDEAAMFAANTMAFLSKDK